MMRRGATLPILQRYQSGISYVEVLIAVIILAVSIVPAANALRGGLRTAGADVLRTVNHYRIMTKLEEVLADSFASVDAQTAGPTVATAYSDAIGTIDRRLVYISGYDGDNADSDDDPFTGIDSGLLLVRVTIEETISTQQSLMTDQ